METEQNKILQYTIAIGIGDSILTRLFFDTVKDQYNQIRISYNETVIRDYRDETYRQFLQELGELLFTSHPYHFDHADHPFMDNSGNIFKELKIVPKKSDLKEILCKGEPLNISEEYVIITTKVRAVSREMFAQNEEKLWDALKEVSNKYKIVIMGERNVEISKEYEGIQNFVYCIYDKIVANISADRIIDLSVPALGISVPNLAKIKQDCLIMNKARYVITIGIGGNFVLSAAVANTIGFKSDHEYNNIDLLANPEYPTIFLARDWDHFISKIKS